MFRLIARGSFFRRSWLRGGWPRGLYRGDGLLRRFQFDYIFEAFQFALLRQFLLAFPFAPGGCFFLFAFGRQFCLLFAFALRRQFRLPLAFPACFQFL